MPKIFFLTLVFLCFGCVRKVKIHKSALDCEGKIYKAGKIRLDFNSLDFIPYDGHRDLIFINKKGEEIIFQILQNKRKYSRPENIRYTCKDGSEFYINCFKEKSSMSFYNEKLDLKLNLFLSSKHARNLEFYDLLSIGLNYETFPDSNSRLSIITSYKNGEIINDNYIESISRSNFQSELDTLEKTFLNVYSKKNKKGKDIFYSQGYGLIGFTDLNNEFWIYDGQKY